MTNETRKFACVLTAGVYKSTRVIFVLQIIFVLVIVPENSDASHRRQRPMCNEMDQTDPPPCFDILSSCKCTVRDVAYQRITSRRF